MAKTLTVNVDHEYTSGRGEVETVAHALEWLEKYTADEEGNVMSPGDLIVYAVRRLRALHKDNKRIAKGVAAERIYLPRIEEGLPKKVVSAIHALDDAIPETTPEPSKPAPKKPAAKSSKPAEAKPAAPRARKAKPAAVKPAEGGAEVTF